MPNCETQTNRCLRRGGLVLPGCILRSSDRLLGLGSGTGDRTGELAIIALIFQKALRSVSSFFPCYPFPCVHSALGWLRKFFPPLLPSATQVWWDANRRLGPALRKIALPGCVLNHLKGGIVRFYLAMPPTVPARAWTPVRLCPPIPTPDRGCFCTSDLYSVCR